MIEVRELNKNEFNRLIDEAPETETRNIRRILGNNAYDYLKNNSKESFGIISNNRPIYMGVLSNNNYLWTVANSNIKEQFSLFKYSKKKVYDCLNKFGIIYAKMEKINEKNIKWSLRIGFKKISEDNNIITLQLGG